MGAYFSAAMLGFASLASCDGSAMAFFSVAIHADAQMRIEAIARRLLKVNFMGGLH